MDVPSKEENAQNGLPESDWHDAQYDMLYLPVTETVRYHYDFNGNRTATVLPDSYDPLAKVRNWTTEGGESRQQTHYFHYFHYDQIGTPRTNPSSDCKTSLSALACSYCQNG